MYRLIAHLRGVSLLLLVSAQTILMGTAIFLIMPLKFLTTGRLRSRVVSVMEWIAHRGWCSLNGWLMRHLLPTRWTIRGDAKITRDRTYLLIANHRSWNDLFAMMVAFTDRVPPYKVFIKQQLIWLPVVGQVVWAIDFPFMKRYTREQVRANPNLKGRDVETTRRMFARYGDRQVTIFNFVEGTRITEAKHSAQQSPYKHLLKPKAGGVAYAIRAIGNKLDAVLDVTFFYVGGPWSFWDLFCGRIPEVIIDVREVQAPAAIGQGDYNADDGARQTTQEWITGIWRDKDALLEQLTQETGAPGRR